MSVSNKHGHGVTNVAGVHNQDVAPASVNFHIAPAPRKVSPTAPGVVSGVPAGKSVSSTKGTPYGGK